MKRMSWSSTALALVASCAWVLPPQIATAAAPASVSTQDVQLAAGGALHGRVLDPFGEVRADEPIILRTRGEEVTRTATDAEGRFSVTGLRGGLYEVVTADTSAAYRLWAEGTAPPSADGEVVLVSGETVYRGQSFGGGGLSTTARVLIGVGIAAAIAIPVAIAVADDDDDRNS